MMEIKISTKDIATGDDLARLGDKAAWAVSDALNRGLGTMKTQSVKNISRTYGILQKKLREKGRLTEVYARQTDGRSVKMVGSSRRFRLTAFSARPAKPGGRRPKRGVSVLVKRSTGRKTIKGSFAAASSRGGHIFLRVGARQARRRGTGGPVRPRYPIQSLLGPSPGAMMTTDQKVRQAILEAGAQTAVERLESNIRFLLTGSRK